MMMARHVPIKLPRERGDKSRVARCWSQCNTRKTMVQIGLQEENAIAREGTPTQPKTKRKDKTTYV